MAKSVLAKDRFVRTHHVGCAVIWLKQRHTSAPIRPPASRMSQQRPRNTRTSCPTTLGLAAAAAAAAAALLRRTAAARGEAGSTVNRYLLEKEALAAKSVRQCAEAGRCGQWERAARGTERQQRRARAETLPEMSQARLIWWALYLMNQNVTNLRSQTAQSAGE